MYLCIKDGVVLRFAQLAREGRPERVNLSRWLCVLLNRTVGHLLWVNLSRWWCVLLNRTVGHQVRVQLSRWRCVLLNRTVGHC